MGSPRKTTLRQFLGSVSGAVRGDVSGALEVWSCDKAKDLTEAAHKTIDHLASVLEESTRTGLALLVTIESVFEPAAFPAILDQFTRDADWGYDRRFRLDRVANTSGETTVQTCRLTAEFTPGMIKRVLAFNGGFRWNANLAVHGVCVPDSAVQSFLAVDLFRGGELPAEVEQIELAFKLDSDLNSVDIFKR
ncbi:MAG: hypothetical protein GY716_17770 [bacterium]|nr:hypothetical protein [bacterium]